MPANPNFRVQPGSLQPHQVEHINRWAIAAKEALVKQDEEITALKAQVEELDARRCAAELHIQRRRRAWADDRKEAQERQDFLRSILTKLEEAGDCFTARQRESLSDAIFDLRCELSAPAVEVRVEYEPLRVPNEHTFNNK